LPGGGRKLTSEELEAALADRILTDHADGKRVSRTMITEWGRELAYEFEIELALSHGWLEGFMLRNGFVLHAATNKPTFYVDEITSRASSFVRNIKGLIAAHNITPEYIYCLD
jgi:hypothetical protein